MDLETISNGMILVGAGLVGFSACKFMYHCDRVINACERVIEDCERMQKLLDPYYVPACSPTYKLHKR